MFNLYIKHINLNVIYERQLHQANAFFFLLILDNSTLCIVEWIHTHAHRFHHNNTDLLNRHDKDIEINEWFRQACKCNDIYAIQNPTKKNSNKNNTQWEKRVKINKRVSCVWNKKKLLQNLGQLAEFCNRFKFTQIDEILTYRIAAQPMHNNLYPIWPTSLWLCRLWRYFMHTRLKYTLTIREFIFCCQNLNNFCLYIII